MFHTMNEIFDSISKKTSSSISFKIKVSFLEIYNETIRDLLVPSNSLLDLREDPVKGIFVAGLSDIEVKSVSEILDLLTEGNYNRI